MENSENKSIISTGSSNLTKTEKLLSITQKILSEVKPRYESVKIGNQEWMTRNLDVDRFRNGDLVPHVESGEEWEKVGKNGQPAWCYYDNNPDRGKLYNWYAVNDPRGLALEGWHVPTDDEWTTLINYLGGENIAGLKMKSVESWVNRYNQDGKIINGINSNSSGLNIIPGGDRFPDGSFFSIRGSAFFWSATEGAYSGAWLRNLNNNNGDVGKSSYSEAVGASVRCLRD
jgi:uncharacterized protein (TIGR02145 family)